MTDLFWPPTTQDAPGSTPPLPPTPPVAPPPHRPRPWRQPAAAAAVAALVFGGIGVGVGAALAGNHNGSTGFTIGSPAGSATTAGGPSTSYAAIAANVLPSVVNINVISSNGEDTGSGVILRSDGYILTNNHVIADAVGGGGRVSVTFNDGSTATATITGADQLDDLAVIKVAKTGLKPAVLGTSTAVHVGDAVLAVGSPLGLQGTVTAGIVSALNRPVDTGSQSQSIDPFGQTQPSQATVIDAIQTDAAINPGNSGGPLLNTAGQIIGIDSAIASTGSTSGEAGNIGVGFAIPIRQAAVVADQLIRTGNATHPLLGVGMTDATDANGNPLARIQSLAPGGPAAKAGLQVGDIVVAVAGQNTPDSDAVIAAIRSHQPGERISVTVVHNGARKTVQVTLADAANAQG